jgi:hypothetical protein
VIKMPDAKMLMQLILRALAKVGYTMLVGPWVLASLARAACQRLDSMIRLAAALPHAMRPDIRCPRGHRSETRGVFECRGCGGLFAGWVFQACPICGSSCGHISCEHCGLSIPNPFL